MRDDDLVVSLPGTTYVCDLLQGNGLPSATSHQIPPGREDQGAPMTQAEFHAHAWKAANAKARELGWIV